MKKRRQAVFKLLKPLGYACLLLLFSCSIQKRNYLRGYHIEWKGASAKTNASPINKFSKNNIPALTAALPDTALPPLILICANEHPYPLHKPAGKKNNSNCDTLYLRDGTALAAKIVEINPGEIKYRNCNYLDGPLVIIDKNQAEHIKYANGEVEFFKKEVRTLSQKDDVLDYQVHRLSQSSLVMGLLCFVGIFPVVLAILAIVRGKKALRLMGHDVSLNLKYRRTAKAGIILGIIILALTALALIILFAYLVTVGII